MNINDSVKISEEVVLKIAETAALEIEGVSKVRAKAGKPVSITVDDSKITVFIQLEFFDGYKILEVSEKVQDHVAESLSTMTGMDVEAVNVTVVGIAEK